MLKKTPQFQQQVAPNVQPAAFFRRTGVRRRDVRVMEAAGSVRLPGNSATGSQFPRQTEGLRATWTFWLAPSTESAGTRNTHGHGFLEEATGTEPEHGRISGGDANIWRERLLMSSAERKRGEGGALVGSKVCVLWWGRSLNKPFGSEASPLEPTFRSVLSARLCRGCQCRRKWSEKSIYAQIIALTLNQRGFLLCRIDFF